MAGDLIGWNPGGLGRIAPLLPGLEHRRDVMVFQAARFPKVQAGALENPNGFILNGDDPKTSGVYEGAPVGAARQQSHGNAGRSQKYAACYQPSKANLVRGNFRSRYPLPPDGQPGRLAAQLRRDPGGMERSARPVGARVARPGTGERECGFPMTNWANSHS